ncbi:MAG: hypothetical protein MZU97_16860 [Bacillus subtilis]|nr:hypothetical protein [Bacillus subtilis]
MFDPIVIVVLGGLIGVVLGLFAWFSQHQSKRSVDAVKAILAITFPNADIVVSQDRLSLHVAGSKQGYLIKILPFQPSHELIVTNPDIVVRQRQAAGLAAFVQADFDSWRR